MILSWRNADHVRAQMYTNHVITPAEHARWFESALADPARKLLVIVVDDRDVGLVALNDIDRTAGTAGWGFYIGVEDLRGRGAGTAAAQAVLRKCFEEFGLNRLDCEVLETNAASMRFHEKQGFVPTGRIPARVRRDGRDVDAIMVSLTRERWERLNAERRPSDRAS